MRKFKNVTLFLLAILLTLTLLTGCIAFTQGGIPKTGRLNDTENPGGTSNLAPGERDSEVKLETVVPEREEGETLADIIEDIHPSVVEINATLSNGTSAGSGIIISVAQNNSYILTCQHVVEDATDIKIILANGTKYDAHYVGGLPDQDIAVIKIAVTSGLTHAVIRDIDQAPLRMGEDAIAIGNPLGSLGGTVTKGIISSTAREINIEGTVMTLLQTDASINSGNSGGGLFDKNGYLIGVVNAKATGDNVEGLGFAIPINKAIEIASELIETSNNSTNPYGGLGYIEGKFMLGITAGLTTLPYRYQGVDYGYQIQSNDPYGSFCGALKQGDYIVSINGTTFDEENTIKAALQGVKIGDTLTVVALIRKAVGGGLLQNYTYEAETFTFTIRQYVYGYSYDE